MRVDIKIRISEFPGEWVQGENVMALSFLAQGILKFNRKGGFP